MLCLYTNLPQNTFSSSALNHLSLSTMGRSHTALSKAVVQLFRKKGSYHRLPTRLSAAPRTFAACSRAPTENTQVTTVYSALAVTSLTCSGWLSTVLSSHTLVHLYTTLCYGKHLLTLLFGNLSSKHRK